VPKAIGALTRRRPRGAACWLARGEVGIVEVVENAGGAFQVGAPGLGQRQRRVVRLISVVLRLASRARTCC